MLELGDDSCRLHRQVGEYARGKGVNIMLTLGERAKDIARGFGKERIHFDNKPQLAAYLTDIMKPGDTIIFKASHSMRFEDIIKQVYEIQENS